MRMMWERRRLVVGAAVCVVAGATLGPALANAGEQAWRDVVVRNATTQPVPVNGTITLADDGVTIMNEAITIQGKEDAPIPITPTADVPVRPGVEGLVQLQQAADEIVDDGRKATFQPGKPLLVEQLNCFDDRSALEHATLRTSHGGQEHEMRFPAVGGIVASGPIRMASNGESLVVIATVKPDVTTETGVRCLLSGHAMR